MPAVGGQQLPDHLTVLVDDRERYPLQFPRSLLWRSPVGRDHLIRCRQKTVRLPVGDYTVEGYEHLVLVEHKRGMVEVHTNVCTKDAARFYRSLRRMAAACRRPLLFWDVTPTELYRPSKYAPEPAVAVDKLSRLCAEASVHLLVWAAGHGQRNVYRAAEFLLRYIWNVIVVCMQTPERRTA